MTNITMNTGAASLSDEQKRAAITACALMIKGICLATPNAEWTERIENRIHYMLRQIATTPQADAAIAAGGAQEPMPGTSEYGSWINKAKQATDCKLSFHRDQFKYLCQFEQELRKAFAPAASNGEQA